MACDLSNRRSARVASHDSQRTQTSLVVLSLLLFLLVLAGSSQASAQTVVFQSDFEDGTTTGWYPFGSPTLTNTTLAAHGGTNSLLTTGRTDTWQGPAHDLPIGTFAPGSTFHFSAWVRVTDAEAANGDKVTMSIKRTDAAGDHYESVGPYQAAVTNTWLQLSGDYTVPAGATALTLYFQLANNDDFFVDDVTITSATLPPPTGCAAQDNTGISTDFEDGTLQGWMARGSGSATAAVVDTEFHGGANSLYVTGRDANWNGAQIAVDNKICVGSQYSVSAWVKIDPADGTNHIINMSLQTNYAGNAAYTGLNGYPGLTVAADGNWHEIKVPNFSMAAQYDAGTAFLYLQTDPSGSDLTSFYVDDFKLTYLPPLQIEQNIASVYQHFTDYFNIGAAVGPADMSGAHSQLLAKHFNSITSGNDMKWDATEPTENTFRFANADAQVAFAQANGMQVRGHTLLWHNQTPAWVFQKAPTSTPLDPATPTDVDLLKARLQNHIHNVMSHFGNKAYAWDVVNEIIDESQSDCLRRSPWYNILGPQFMDIAFQYARAESATAKLFINDYNSTIPNKRQCLYQVVQGMINRGVPVDGVGHQMHNLLTYPSVQTLVDTVNLFHGLTTVAGVPLDQQVTEFDISIYPYPPPEQGYEYDLIPTDLLVQEGYLYRDYFEAMKKLNSDPNDKKISSVTIWGMSDDETWLSTGSRADAPLLFDTKLQHKYAYTGIMDPLSLPGADLAVTMSAGSSTAFSGHPLSYTITVTNNGHDQAANVVVSDALPASLKFQSIASPAGWTCTTPAVGSSGSVSCTAATMDNGAAAQFALVVSPSITSAAQITNTVTVASDTRDPNPDASNNTASASVQATLGDFTMDAINTAWAPLGGVATRTVTLHSVNGYAGTVTVSCTTGWGGACTGQQVTLPADGQATATLSITVASSASIGNSTITINATSGTITHTASASAFAIVDVTGNITQTSLTMTRGGSATTTVSLTGSAGFNGTAQLACNAPAGLSCTFTPASVTLNGSSATSSLVISASSSASLRPASSNSSMLWVALLGGPFLACIGGIRRKHVMLALLLVALAATVVLAGCGADLPNLRNSGGGTPSTYSVSITASVPQTTVVKTLGTVNVIVNH